MLHRATTKLFLYNRFPRHVGFTYFVRKHTFMLIYLCDRSPYNRPKNLCIVLQNCFRVLTQQGTRSVSPNREDKRIINTT